MEIHNNKTCRLMLIRIRNIKSRIHVEGRRKRNRSQPSYRKNLQHRQQHCKYDHHHQQWNNIINMPSNVKCEIAMGKPKTLTNDMKSRWQNQYTRNASSSVVLLGPASHQPASIQNHVSHLNCREPKIMFL